MAVRTLWRFVVGRAKTLIKNYNVIERADKIMENEIKRAPPRHPGTEAKFKVLVKGSDLEIDMEKKPVELLDRLKLVKVTSHDAQIDQKESRPLPTSRHSYQLPLYGYEEPKSVAEGKCTLRQALEFITNHQNDPSKYSIASIAETYKMKSSDVEQVINNFRAYQLYISRDSKVGMTKSALQALGATKIQEQLYRSGVADKNKENAIEEKK